MLLHSPFLHRAERAAPGDQTAHEKIIRKAGQQRKMHDKRWLYVHETVLWVSAKLPYRNNTKKQGNRKNITSSLQHYLHQHNIVPNFVSLVLSIVKKRKTTHRQWEAVAGSMSQRYVGLNYAKVNSFIHSFDCDE
jgi:hypothetical protein